MSSMKTNIILRCSVTLMIILQIISQYSSASTQDMIYNTTFPCDIQEHNVSFYCHAYSNKERITNQSLPVVWFVKDVRLSIFFEMSFYRYNKFKVWNDTGVIIDGKIDHCFLTATNYTGIIIHRRGVLGYVWHLYGSCKNFKLDEPYN